MKATAQGRAARNNQAGLEITTHSARQTQQTGALLGKHACPGDVYLLVGELGAGKTCLAQGIARGLGISDYVSSPSFVLVREMHGRLPLYHADLYRLDRIEEIADLGLDEYLYGPGVTVVEWADRALALFPPDHLLIQMERRSATGRLLTFKPAGERYVKLVDRLKLSLATGLR